MKVTTYQAATGDEEIMLCTPDEVTGPVQFEMLVSRGGTRLRDVFRFVSERNIPDFSWVGLTGIVRVDAPAVSREAVMSEHQRRAMSTEGGVVIAERNFFPPEPKMVPLVEYNPLATARRAWEKEWRHLQATGPDEYPTAYYKTKACIDMGHPLMGTDDGSRGPDTVKRCYCGENSEPNR